MIQEKREELFYQITDKNGDHIFNDRKHLVKMIINKENEKREQVPNQFGVSILSPFDKGESKAELGRVHKFYFLGINSNKTGKEYIYQVFDGKQSLIFYIMKMGLKPKEQAFWLTKINEI